LRKLASSLVLTLGLMGGSVAFAAVDAGGGGTPDARVVDAPTTTTTTTTTDEDDGCGCHVGGTSTLGGGAALLGLVGLGLALVKRRR
jgi:MYXO-CTERM domain-containing protein